MDSISRHYDGAAHDHRSMNDHGDHVEASPRTVKTTKVAAAHAGEGWYHDAAIRDDRDNRAHPYR